MVLPESWLEYEMFFSLWPTHTRIFGDLKKKTSSALVLGLQKVANPKSPQ